MSKNRINKSIIFHIICWLLLFAFLILLRKNQAVSFIDYCLPVIVIFVYICIFYINFKWLIDQLLIRKKRILAFIIVNLIIILFFYIFGEFLRKYISDFSYGMEFHADAYPVAVHPASKELSGNMFSTLLHSFMDFILLSLVVAFSVSIKYIANYYNLKNKTAELIRINIETELQQLKTQINPHFYFNTLNNIYSLILISPESAQRAILGLGKLMRYVLYEASNDKVPLKDELQFISNSLELYSLRLGKNVDIHISLPEVDEHQMIAPMILVPLIENAFKHGVCGDNKSKIDIDIKFSDGTVSCRVVNTYFIKFNSKVTINNGIGLENLKRRLFLIYPQRYTYKAYVEKGMYYAELSIKI